MKQFTWFFLYLLCNPLLFSQKIDCEKITSFLNEKETQIKHFNLQNPDYIPLHYLMAKDMINELKKFKNETLPHFSPCETITFNEVIDRFDALKSMTQLKYDSLNRLNESVYLIFYEKALHEYRFNNEADAEYYLFRCLQYNETYPNAILLKLNKLLDKNSFEECLALLNTLYYEAELDRVQEMQAIEFTDKFYNKLYQTGDSLVKKEQASGALKLFEILEIFCLNLPSSYCNDDYFRGVMRSKSGIYDSYLAIAKVAEARGNQTIAMHFYEYAQEYLEENPHLQNYERSEVQEVQEIQDIQKEYDSMVLKALALCMNEEFEASYALFLEAQKMEECRCFKTDYRVDLMVGKLKVFLR